MKKGQGLSFNVIIIAAIALLVLVILAVIFIGRMGADESKDFDFDKCGDCEFHVTNCWQGCIFAETLLYPNITEQTELYDACADLCIIAEGDVCSSQCSIAGGFE